MEIFRFSSHLRLRHPYMDPNVISEALGRIPRRQWRLGELKRGPEGKELGRTYDHTYWASEPSRGEDSALIDVLKSDLDDLGKKTLFLEEFCSTGGSIEYYISWFTSDRSGGETISHTLLRRLADLYISLSLDVYGPERVDHTGSSSGALEDNSAPGI